jgi:hypothetical protein
MFAHRSAFFAGKRRPSLNLAFPAGDLLLILLENFSRTAFRASLHNFDNRRFLERRQMLEALITAAGLGFLLGLRYRIPAVVAASAVVAAATFTLALMRGAPLWVVLIAPMGAIVALQGGYLLALMLPHTTYRAGSWEDMEGEDREPTQRHARRQASVRVAPDGGAGEREPSARPRESALAQG